MGPKRTPAANGVQSSSSTGRSRGSPPPATGPNGNSLSRLTANRKAPKPSAGTTLREERGHHRLPSEKGTGHHHQVGVAKSEGLAPSRVTEQKRNTAHHQCADQHASQSGRHPRLPIAGDQPLWEWAPYRPGVSSCFQARCWILPQRGGTPGRPRGRGLSARVNGQGHGINTAPISPIAVPVNVSGNGISRPSRSHTVATIRKAKEQDVKHPHAPPFRRINANGDGQVSSGRNRPDRGYCG